VVSASDPFSGPREWEDWEIKTYPGACELQLLHRAVVPPFYPDLYIRFGVGIVPRNASGAERALDVYGKLHLSLYSYLPNVPTANRPLNRIEKAVFAGRTMEILKMPNDDMYRVLQLQQEDATAVLNALREAQHRTGNVDLELQLSDGTVLTKKVRPGSYFNTRARMLSVCMVDGFTH